MIRAIEEVIMEFKVGEKVRIVKIHEKDAFYSWKELIGKQGIIIEEDLPPVKRGYFAGKINLDFDNRTRDFYAVELEKVEDK